MLRRSTSRAGFIAVCATVLAALPLASLYAAGKAGSRAAAASESDRSKSEEKAKVDDSAAADSESADENDKPIHKSDREWKRLLTAKQYRVTRQKETELPFSGKYVHSKKEGVYRCVCCGAKLFGSDTKFDSRTGWPSFFAPLREKALATADDYSDGTPRLEVICSRCDAHLGHVFGDGPPPTGLRYCINSAALKLDETAKPGGKKSGRDK